MYSRIALILGLVVFVASQGVYDRTAFGGLRGLNYFRTGDILDRFGVLDTLRTGGDIFGRLRGLDTGDVRIKGLRDFDVDDRRIIGGLRDLDVGDRQTVRELIDSGIEDKYIAKNLLKKDIIKNQILKRLLDLDTGDKRIFGGFLTDDINDVTYRRGVNTLFPWNLLLRKENDYRFDTVYGQNRCLHCKYGLGLGYPRYDNLYRRDLF